MKHKHTRSNKLQRDVITKLFLHIQGEFFDTLGFLKTIRDRERVKWGTQLQFLENS